MHFNISTIKILIHSNNHSFKGSNISNIYTFKYFPTLKLFFCLYIKSYIQTLIHSKIQNSGLSYVEDLNIQTFIYLIHLSFSNMQTFIHLIDLNVSSMQTFKYLSISIVPIFKHIFIQTYKYLHIQLFKLIKHSNILLSSIYTFT